VLKLINRSYNWKIRHAINGPLDEVDTCRKLFIKFIRVHKFIFNNVYVDFAESVMANNNSRLIKVSALTTYRRPPIYIYIYNDSY